MEQCSISIKRGSRIWREKYENEIVDIDLFDLSVKEKFWNEFIRKNNLPKSSKEIAKMTSVLIFIEE